MFLKGEPEEKELGERPWEKIKKKQKKILFNRAKRVGNQRERTELGGLFPRKECYVSRDVQVKSITRVWVRGNIWREMNTHENLVGSGAFGV